MNLITKLRSVTKRFSTVIIAVLSSSSIHSTTNVESCIILKDQVINTHFSVFFQVSRKRKNCNKKFSIAQPEQDEMNNSDAQSRKRPKPDESVKDNISSPHYTPHTGNKRGKRGKKRQNEEGFQPFDYSKVNFSRFQGGSKVSVTNHRNELKPKVSW